MNASSRNSVRTLWTALRMMALMTLVLGLAYPLLITAVGQLLLPAQANGSIVHTDGGVPVGSALLGQSFTDDAGHPLPQYFQPRPSVAGTGYDATASSGSNLGPENPELIAAITQRRTELAEFNGVPLSQVPADAVTSSGSGLDPDISAAYAAIQIERVARVRGLPVDVVRALVQEHTQGPDLGYLGQTRVNVLGLNLALDEVEAGT